MPGSLRQGVVIVPGNATPHTASYTSEWLRHYGDVMGRRPYSRDVVSSDFHLFGFFEKHLAGKRFATDADVKQAVTSWLQTLDTSLFFNGIQVFLVPRWDKCLNVNGDYVEV
jgi:hypothetical protein